MKIRTILSLCALTFASMAYAQSYNMNVRLTDGTVYTQPANRVEKVTFDEASVLPDDAGFIKMDFKNDGKVMLSVENINNATSYIWYKDGKVVQNSSSRYLLATEAGKYKVAGANHDGEGKSSAEVQVTLCTGAPFNILTSEFIPDANLLDYIKTNIANGAETFTNLQAAQYHGGFKITSKVAKWDGIQYFVGLDSLICVGNQFAKADLTSNVNLKKIDFNRCGFLTDLNVAGLSELVYLNIGHTKLENFDLSVLPDEIAWLDISRLKYTELDLSRFKNLQHLVAQQNSDITSLDFSNNDKLNYLDLSNLYKMTSLNLGNCTLLKHLNISSCAGLSSVDLSACQQIEYLYVLYSGISQMEFSPEQKQHLVEFTCNNSKITHLDVANMPNLKLFQAEGCSLNQDLDFSGSPLIENLHLEDTGITSLNLEGCNNLYELNVYNDNITELKVPDSPNLFNLNVFNNVDQTKLELGNYPSAFYISCYMLPKVKRIDISKCNPKASIYLDYNDSLKEVKVWEGFDIENPPTNITIPATAKFVYSFTSESE